MGRRMDGAVDLGCCGWSIARGWRLNSRPQLNAAGCLLFFFPPLFQLPPDDVTSPALVYGCIAYLQVPPLGTAGLQSRGLCGLSWDRDRRSWARLPGASNGRRGGG